MTNIRPATAASMAIEIRSDVRRTSCARYSAKRTIPLLNCQVLRMAQKMIAVTARVNWWRAFMCE
jgi:hypothetical protein